ncbi:hypothetical protein [Rhodococcoides corynebacterioides]|uniref:Colicin import membrane protein n=1 Tax=Rhodococcoides corynebacterioides TaxID=53972 RepID=A0ABS7P6M1_9NOCA|nr:hypothetical protein [Rhodococcus corynebacterioides]MBY6368072.1 hypothetical protein [Rhodococcus corynebacterioides]MBY6409795.1 hypothetical protein [Rhodococcus corynebacterioides]
MSDEHQTLSRDTGMVLRTSLQVAMQVAEALARRREQNLRVAAAASDARARSLAARLAAERRSAEAVLQRASDRRWWATATDEQIVDVVRVAHTWKDTSPVADRAATSIEERLRLDKGVDLPELRDTVATAAVAAAVERELADRARRETVFDETGPEGVADDRDGAATPPEEPAVPLTRIDWDTPQRRAHTASALTAAGVDGEAVDAHLLTDTANSAALDATSMRSPTGVPEATSGERGTDVDRSIDRGGR